jgi:hypothetical protein
MDGFYRSLFLVSGHRLLGRPLLPFSLWHYAQLDHLKSPLVGHAGEINLTALRTASCICVTHFPETLLVTPRSWWEAARHDVALRWAALNISRARQEWRLYLNAQGAKPVMRQYGKNGTRFCECPAPLALWSAAMSRGNFTEAEAWDMPVRRSAWYKIGLAEAEGAEFNLVTDAWREAMIKAGRGHMLQEVAS